MVRIIASCLVGNSTANSIQGYLWKNNAQHAFLFWIPLGTGMGSGTCVVSCVAGDQLNVRVAAACTCSNVIITYEKL